MRCTKPMAILVSANLFHIASMEKNPMAWSWLCICEDSWIYLPYFGPFQQQSVPWLFMVKVHIYSIICSYCCPRINNNNNQAFLVVPSHYESCVLHDIIYRNRMFSRGLSPPLLYHHFFCLFLFVQYQVVGVWEGGKLLSCILSNPAEKWKWNFLLERWWLALLSLHNRKETVLYDHVVDAFIGKRYQRRPKQAAHQE
jgi:hypothetical protein